MKIYEKIEHGDMLWDFKYFVYFSAIIEISWH